MMTALYSESDNDIKISDKIIEYVTPKGDHWLSQRYSELHLNRIYETAINSLYK